MPPCLAAPPRKTVLTIVGEDFHINETNVAAHDHEILKPKRVHELIERVQRTERDGRRLLVGTSFGGGAVPLENVVRASDFLLLHVASRQRGQGSCSHRGNGEAKPRSSWI